MIRGKQITYHINKTEYLWGLSQKIRSAAHLFHKKSGLQRIFSIKNLACGAFFSQKIFFLIIRGCISDKVFYSVYEFISSENFEWFELKYWVITTTQFIPNSKYESVK